MSPAQRRSPIVVAVSVAALLFIVQVLSALIAPIGDAIRDLPVVPVALVVVTLYVGLELIRSR
jgi:predicted tellurium resistance membrane protein TerC